MGLLEGGGEPAERSLADLSVGRWGETTAALIGSFLVAKLWQAVLARSAIEEEQRRDFFLFIDEFQHFLGIAGPFADALAQARSLRLSLTIANQHLGQLPRDFREAISSNARSRAVFQCGYDDATALAREFAPLDATALMSLPRFEMAARLSIGGQTSEAFTLRTLPPSQIADPAVAAEAKSTSLRRYAGPSSSSTGSSRRRSRRWASARSRRLAWVGGRGYEPTDSAAGLAGHELPQLFAALFASHFPGEQQTTEIAQ